MVATLTFHVSILEAAVIEELKDYDVTNVLLFLAPGASFAVFRSFAIKGFFPKLSKDDLGALTISSSLFLVSFKLAGIDLSSPGIFERRSAFLWVLLLFVVPAFIGAVSGLVEAADRIGRSLRRLGLRLPSPEPNAWETMFREMPSGSILMVRLSDETWVYGRWIEGSASSHMSDARDLYLSEIGALSGGNYSSYVPRRGAYFGVGEIKRIEIVNYPSLVPNEVGE